MLSRIATLLALSAGVTDAFVAPAMRSNSRCKAPVMSVEDSRRQMMTQAGQLLVGLGGLAISQSASAKAGQFAKQSFFGAKSQSTPYSFTEKTSKDYVYKGMDAEELDRMKLVVSKSTAKIESIKASIDDKKWEDARTALRRQVYALRGSMLNVNANIPESKEDEAARLYTVFVRTMEKFDFAMSKKDSERSLSGLASTVTALKEWTAYAL